MKREEIKESLYASIVCIGTSINESEFLETDTLQDLGLDSFDTTHLIMDLEKKHDIGFTEDEMDSLNGASLHDFIELVKIKISSP